MTNNGKSLAFIEAPAGERPIELRELVVEAVITGLYAETTQTMVFFNPNARPLEGSLTFPLPEGAVVSGYALDVEGRMVDGVVVARQEARRILEAEIRKGVDPGLVEQVAGNLYRTRIYPLPAGGTRRVRITYVNELTCEGNSAHYHLPIPHAATLARVAVRLEVRQAPVTPCLTGLPEIVLQAHEGCWVAEGELPGQVPAHFHLVLPDLPERFAVVESTDQGEVFFCVSAAQSAPESRSWRPRRLAVAWDASGSRPEVARELQFLQALAQEWPGVPAELVVVRHRLEEGRSFADLQELADYLAGLPADGASALALLDFARPPHPECDAWLFFSDGLDTVAPGLPGLGSLPIFPVTGQLANNSVWLAYLAERTQGRWLNLSRQQVPEAVAWLAARSPYDLPVQCLGGSQVHPGRTPGRIQALGQLTRGEPYALVSTGALEALRVEASQARPGRLLARAWAGKELGALQAQGEDGSALLELGRKYGLVTPGASLLVLESLQQYLEYDVCPPESLPEVRQAFLEQRRELGDQREAARRSQLDRVAALWQARVEWWETDFRPQWEFIPRPAKPKPGRAARARGGPADLAPERESVVADLFCCELADPFAAGDPFAAPACEEPMVQAFAAPAAPCPAPESRPQPAAGPTISIQAWDPGTPYLLALNEAGPEGAYQAYLRQRPEYANSPSFFLDCADRLLGLGRREEGLLVLSNLLELGLDDPPLMRMYAWRLQQAGQLDEAISVLQRVLKLRADEPQSYRDLGLVLGDRWERDSDPADAYRAAELLYEVVHRVWDRFPEIELIALMELNRLLARAQRAGVPMPEVDSRLKRLLDLDLRISMSWDADLTDVDLHVYEPSGEHAYYGQNRTRIGGLVSLDFRQGYGPEEYVLRRAMPGEYKVQAHYYGSHQQTLTGPCTVLVGVFTDYGRPEEKRQLLTLRLEKPSSTETVGVVEMKDAAARPKAPGSASSSPLSPG